MIGTRGCTYYSDWNAYYCTNSKIGLLTFESLDEDKLDRTVSPIVITSPNIPSFSNVINSFMDHGWDGFYTSQKRLTRFPALVITGNKYIVSYTGTPPLAQRYRLTTFDTGVTIQIRYTKPGAYQIFDTSNKLISANGFDTTTGYPAAIKGGLKCGENRYEGVTNILEFYLLPDC